MPIRNNGGGDFERARTAGLQRRIDRRGIDYYKLIRLDGMRRRHRQQSYSKEYPSQYCAAVKAIGNCLS